MNAWDDEHLQKSKLEGRRLIGHRSKPCFKRPTSPGRMKHPWATILLKYPILEIGQLEGWATMNEIGFEFIGQFLSLSLYIYHITAFCRRDFSRDFNSSLLNYSRQNVLNYEST